MVFGNKLHFNSIVKARGGGGGGGKHRFFSFHIFDRVAEDKQVENESKSDLAFLRYCVPKSE